MKISRAVPLALAVVILSMVARPAAAQAAHRPDVSPGVTTTLDSYRRAVALIDAAVAAHGGAEALRGARQLRVTTRGHDYHRHQSRRVAPPYDSTLRAQDLMVDLARGRLVMTEQRGYPGGWWYPRRFVTAGDSSWFVDPRAQTYSVERYPAAATQLGNLLIAPQWYVLAALEAPNLGARRWLGRVRLPSGNVVDAVSFPLAGGGVVTMGLDTATHRLAAAMSVGADPFAGDAEIVTEYHGWRDLNGVLLPTSLEQRRAGEVVLRLRYVSAEAGFSVPDSLATAPAGFARAAPPPAADPVRELAPGVWAVRAAGSTTLLVAFADHLLVVDAPPRSAPEVIQRAAALAPGKPIRWVVPTHHHDDHFGGVRHYAAAGATVVTTPGNVAYARQVLSAPASTSGPWMGPAAPSARVEAVAGKRRVFTDPSAGSGPAARTVEIHDIGPSPHADEMLVAWLPAEGILFQGDLIEAPATGEARRGANSETTLHLADVIRRRGWTVRHFVGVHGSLGSPEEFAKLIAMPVLPPE